MDLYTEEYGNDARNAIQGHKRQSLNKIDIFYMEREVKRSAILASLAICFALGHAAIPSGYYSSLEGLTGAELKTAVHNVIYPHREVSSYSALPQYFQYTDVRIEKVNGKSVWWDMYSDIVRYIPSFSGLNREHAFPKSWWKENGSVEYTPAYVDLNHLFPADGPANQAKGNYPLGETNNTSVSGGFNNNVSRIGSPLNGQGAGAKLVFEPDDEYKGDFARTYFYMVTCYQNLHWNSSYMWMLQQNDYPTLTPWAINLLLKWHREDPVSQKEKNRNEVVYGYQNNRNPFIDFQDLAEYIWGNQVGNPFIPGNQSDTPAGTPALLVPTEDMYLDFGDVAVGHTSSSYLLVKGENLTSELNLTVGKYPSGTDFRSMFTLDEKSVSAIEANQSSGHYVKISYTPTDTEVPAEGIEHTARVLISGGGLAGTSSNISVYLQGCVYPEPVLNPLEAYPASDVTASSYKATWSEAEVPVDYYILTRIRTINGQQVTESTETEECYLDIDDFDASIPECYYVQSYRLGYTSPESNIVFVGQSGIADVAADMPLSVESWPGIVRVRCAGVMHAARIIDTMGRTVQYISEISDGYELSLPYGIYFLVTAEHSTPVRVVAR